jgi:hypothetical protein
MLCWKDFVNWCFQWVCKTLLLNTTENLLFCWTIWSTINYYNFIKSFKYKMKYIIY